MEMLRECRVQRSFFLLVASSILWMTPPLMANTCSIAGPWQGTWTGPNTSGPLSATFSQSSTSTSLTGTVTVTNSKGQQTSNVTGTNTNGVLSFGPATLGNTTVYADGGFSGACATISGRFHQDSPNGTVVGSYTAQTPTLSLVVPTQSEDDVLDQSNFTATSKINFQAQATLAPNATQINWTLLLEYTTSGGVAVPSVQKTFTTETSGTNTTHPLDFSGMGGQLTNNAKATILGSVIDAPEIKSVITGTAIPNAEITSRLTTLYNGATPNLMTGIAEVESSYAQFLTEVLYGVSANWPHESAADAVSRSGSHIGLMQMPTKSMAVAFDWLTNTSAGVNFFTKVKVPIAISVMKKIISTHSGLRLLNGVEVENMTLVLYGPFAASTNLTKQYYVPLTTKTGWDWAVNTAGNPKGVAYADHIRASVQ
jgi:hypothetical protein